MHILLVTYVVCMWLPCHAKESTAWHDIQRFTIARIVHGKFLWKNLRGMWKNATANELQGQIQHYFQGISSCNLFEGEHPLLSVRRAWRERKRARKNGRAWARPFFLAPISVAATRGFKKANKICTMGSCSSNGMCLQNIVHWVQRVIAMHIIS